MAFGLLMAPPVMLACVIASAFAICTGKKFAPPAKSGLAKFEAGMMKTSVYALVLIAPSAAIATTLTLNALDYTTCPQLRKSGSAWQTYWVSHPGFCFVPDSYTENGWPCKMVDGKNYALTRARSVAEPGGLDTWQFGCIGLQRVIYALLQLS
ncbi:MULTISPECIES: hypothetical protein [Pseudomonas]|uniref:Transmembrane protein n=2 Tax=Pseudomonas TaxID=286 RepID=A0A7W2QJF4_PSEPU|nr:hypothetical protein [Pseudomonas putida]